MWLLEIVAQILKFPFGTVFSRIPTTTSGSNGNDFGSYILYEPNYSHEILIPNLTLDNLTIRLYDENSNPIQWNGGHWCVLLTITHHIDVGSAGIEDITLGRTHRPYLQSSTHDALQTKHEFHNQKRRRG